MLLALHTMAAIKISSKVEEAEWQALQALARESHQSISGLLTEAISDYLRKRRLRPEIRMHLQESLQSNGELVEQLRD